MTSMYSRSLFDMDYTLGRVSQLISIQPRNNFILSFWYNAPHTKIPEGCNNNNPV